MLGSCSRGMECGYRFHERVADHKTPTAGCIEFVATFVTLMLAPWPECGVSPVEFRRLAGRAAQAHDFRLQIHERALRHEGLQLLLIKLDAVDANGIEGSVKLGIFRGALPPMDVYSFFLGFSSRPKERGIRGPDLQTKREIRLGDFQAPLCAHGRARCISVSELVADRFKGIGHSLDILPE
jgi:hypothetical protein